jgi:uncharacterized membrane protein
VTALLQVLAVVATVFAGLTAGIFFAFSSGVMPGLAQADDRVYVSAMRRINVAVVNPGFLGAIFVTPLALVSAVIAAFAAGAGLSAALLIAALVVSVVGVVGVTAARSVPLNDRLATASDGDALARRAFERPWVAWNHVRSGCAILALILSAVAVAAI